MALTRLAFPLFLVGSNAFSCELPALALIPEDVGDQVAGVLLDVRRYSDSIVEYTNCLKTELQNAGGDGAPALVRSMLVARNNHAAAEHEAITDLFAERVGPLENLWLADYLGSESRDCLLTDSIVSTGVVNAGAVVFFVRRGQAYLNVLERTCQGLDEGKFFIGDPPAEAVNRRTPLGPANSTPLTSRVCDSDNIFPYRDGSTRLTLGCPLGRFYSVSESQGQQILADFKRPPPIAAAPAETP